MALSSRAQLNTWRVQALGGRRRAALRPVLEMVMAQVWAHCFIVMLIWNWSNDMSGMFGYVRGPEMHTEPILQYQSKGDAQGSPFPILCTGGTT